MKSARNKGEQLLLERNNYIKELFEGAIAFFILQSTL
jgi:hypothetical protein